VDPLSVIEGGGNQKENPAYGADTLRLWVSGKRERERERESERERERERLLVTCYPISRSPLPI
jgi:hypothetical protein